ncbi:hypothetical protein FXO37_17696 [Capsicum annuum]|nr:hypothetical protein FXO37_17696 [Capsicum annuum]
MTISSATALALSFTNRFSLTGSAFLRRQTSPSSAMSIAGEQNYSSEAAHLDSIFKQKKALRSVVKRDLKSMDPTLRSQQGGHGFKPWKQLAEMQGKAAYDTPLWWGPSSDTVYRDEAIQKIVLGAPWFKACKGLCAYISCSALREVDTTQILSHILGGHPEDLQMRKKLFVPRVEDRNRNMRMLNISSTEDLIANSMDILEPAPLDADGNEREDVLFANEPVDLLLLPVALSYSVQIVDDGTIPLTPNDILVDALVSPSGVIPISPAALEICR